MTEIQLELRIEELIFLPPYTNILVKIIGGHANKASVYCLQDKVVLPAKAIFTEDYHILESYVIDDEYYEYRTSGVYSNKEDNSEIELNPKFPINGKYFEYNKDRTETAIEKTAKRKENLIDINLYQGKAVTLKLEIVTMDQSADFYTLMGYINGYEVVLQFDITLL